MENHLFYNSIINEIVNQLDKECNFFFKSLKIPKIPKKHYVTPIIIKVVWNFVISKKKRY